MVAAVVMAVGQWFEGTERVREVGMLRRWLRGVHTLVALCAAVRHFTSVVVCMRRWCCKHGLGEVCVWVWRKGRVTLIGAKGVRVVLFVRNVAVLAVRIVMALAVRKVTVTRRSSNDYTTSSMAIGISNSS